MFYITCASLIERSELIEHLKQNDIHAVFHYLSLNKSPYYLSTIGESEVKSLENSDRYTDTLLRLPIYYELDEKDIKKIVDVINDYYK